MLRGLLRPFGFALLAVLAASPVVRTLCVYDCGPSAAESEPATMAAEHCARPSAPGAAEAETAGLTAVDGCNRCDVPGETLRATVRAETAGLTAPPPAPSPVTSHHDLKSFHLVSASARSPSPPLRAPYPLRI